MGYLSIDNLYKPQAQAILEFKQVYALEKIHGTSAHVRLKPGEVTLFSGGESLDKFRKLFGTTQLLTTFAEKFGEGDEVIFYGEAYGGKQQGMSGTYGPNLKFIVFDVTIGDRWLSVPQAHDLATSFGLEFVAYRLISSDIETLNAERDLPSVQAVRNGITEPKPREGIVLRPPFECESNRGRLIAKHKGETFNERETGPNLIDPVKASELEKAEAIAEEWATPMRLEHVIDHIIREREAKVISMEDTRAVITEMIEDVKREATVEVQGKEVSKAIGEKTAKLLKARLQADLEASHV